MAFNIIPLCKVTLSITHSVTLSIMTLNISVLSIIAPSIRTYCTTTSSIEMILCIKALSISTKHEIFSIISHYSESGNISNYA